MQDLHNFIPEIVWKGFLSKNRDLKNTKGSEVRLHKSGRTIRLGVDSRFICIGNLSHLSQAVFVSKPGNFRIVRATKGIVQTTNFSCPILRLLSFSNRVFSKLRKQYKRRRCRYKLYNYIYCCFSLNKKQIDSNSKYQLHFKMISRIKY